MFTSANCTLLSFTEGGVQNLIFSNRSTLPKWMIFNIYILDTLVRLTVQEETNWLIQ